MIFTDKWGTKQKVYDYINEGILTEDVVFELKNKPYCDVDENDLKEIFIVWNNYKKDETYIIKCPVIGSTQRSYIINIKDRDGSTKYENYRELKILKKEINQYIHYKASSTYEIAFAFLLMQEQRKILKALQDKDDIDLYRLFIEASNHNSFVALEIIAEELEMDYLLRLDDDTKSEKEN